ncbi:MAG: hypothetical protein AAFN70_21645, partial [Planctomycetota bacterium]
MTLDGATLDTDVPGGGTAAAGAPAKEDEVLGGAENIGAGVDVTDRNPLPIGDGDTPNPLV